LPFVPPDQRAPSPNSTPLYFVPSGSKPSASAGNSSSRGKRRAWTPVEIKVLWEIYEALYMNGTITSKTSKGNGPGWEELQKRLTKALADRNIAPRTLNQIKEKINNLKAEYKRIRDKESQTGEGTQPKPEWFNMVDRVFGSKDEIAPPYLVDTSSKSSDSSPPSPPECSDPEDAPSRKRQKKEKMTKKKSGVELVTILEKQVQLLESGQEKEERMMNALLEMEEKAEERQKAILMAIIDKL